ncbi:MAG: hydroxysqualene dehydroxylase HpnE [Bryobacteraceae bacterium]
MPPAPRVAVLGGGLAGLATAAALGSAGYEVDLFESKAYLGGRATSYALPSGETPAADHIDNCQHILLRCCVNLLDFYRRLHVEKDITFHREFFFIEPGGRMSTMKAGILPTPFHFAGSFHGLQFLNLADKIAIGKAMLAVRRERNTRTDLDQISMLDWLKEKRQTPQAIERFWLQILVSAINEDLDKMAAAHGFQVTWLGFLAAKNSYEMGIPNVPLGELYGSDAWKTMPTVNLRFREPVEALSFDGSRVAAITSGGETHSADFVVSGLPFEKLQPLAGDRLAIDWPAFTHSPITGVHLWFDRPITDLPHATLLDRTIQWMFNKGEGRYLQLVISASRSLTPMSRGDVIAMALRELGEFFPAAREAKLEKAHVVKEIRATFSAAQGLEAKRPLAKTAISNLFLAGDWTRSGWPATMEGAVRSGYLAAEAVTIAAGDPKKFLLPDIA